MKRLLFLLLLIPAMAWPVTPTPTSTAKPTHAVMVNDANEIANGIVKFPSGKTLECDNCTLIGFGGGGGSGDVVGPSSATDGHLAVFDGTDGKLLKDGGASGYPKVVAFGRVTDQTDANPNVLTYHTPDGPSLS